MNGEDQIRSLIQQEMASEAPAPEMQAPERALAAPELDIENQVRSEIQKEIRAEQYGTPTQKAIALGEAGLRGLVSGPVAIGLELATGLTTKEDIAKRKEELGEGWNLVGEGVGFLLPTIATAGLGAAARAGIASAGLAQKAAALSQFTQAGAISSVANIAAKKATTDVAKKVIALSLEGAILQTADEATKAILSPEPNAALANIGSAALNVGGAAVFGGALGYGAAKLPLWTAKFSKPVQQMADDLAGANPEAITLNGVGAGLATEAERKTFKQAILEKKTNSSEIKQAAARQGLPLREAMLSKSSWIQRVESSLTKSPTIFGALARLVYDKGYDKADNVLLQAMKTNLPPQTSRAELGQAIVDSLEPEIRKTKDLMSELYGLIKKETQVIPVAEKDILDFTDNLLKNPWVRDNPSSPIASFAKGVANDLKTRVAEGDYTVENLRNVIGTLGTRIGYSAEERAFLRETTDLMVDLQDTQIKKFAKQMVVPDRQAKQAVNSLLKQIKDTNQKYAPFKNNLRKLAKGLGFGEIKGPADFLVKLTESTPEKITKRIFAKDNAKFLEFMNTNFKKELDLVMDFEKNELLKRFSKREKLKTMTLIDEIKKLPKEVQEVMFGKNKLQAIDDVKTWINALPENVNPSNSSQGIAFNEYFGAKGLAMTAADLGKVAVLKMISAGERPTAAGVKAMTDYFNATHSGYTMINKAVRTVFSDKEKEKFPVPDPKPRELDALNKQAEEFQKNPSAFMNMAGDLEEYLPEQAQAQKISAARVYSYLNQKRPKEIQSGILDRPRPPSIAQQQDYKRTLQIAEQPGIVLKKLYQGNLQSKDIQDLNTMYPELRNQFLMDLMRQLVPKISKGEQIPYKIRKGLSLFGAMPLDANMKPQAIQSAQAVFQKNNVPLQQQQLPQMAPKSSRKSQLPSLTETDSQRRMLNR